MNDLSKFTFFMLIITIAIGIFWLGLYFDRIDIVNHCKHYQAFYNDEIKYECREVK